MKFEINSKKKFYHRSYYFIICVLFIVLLTGCDAFVRKFRRKPKKDVLSQKEMVLVPEEYPSLFANKEEEYRYYFLFWQSWHSEFLNSLLENASHKKKISCISEAIKNLNILKELLLDEKKSGLEKYIEELKDLQAKLSQDTYTFNVNWYYNRAEILRKDISQHYSYQKIKDYLK
jgi:hypothetical protein